jgi:DNA-binding transcriptional LysR family regulator
VNLAGIDTNLVVALHALLQERSVTRAARRLGLGQPATSHALARLRAHFGDELLVRSGREMVLTGCGRRLFDPVAAVVAGLEQVFSPPGAFDPATSRRVFRVAATDNLELYVLPRLAPLIEKEAPHVRLRFFHLPEDWPSALRRGDMELKLGRKAPLGPGFHDEDLFRDRMVCVVRRGHPLRGPLTLPAYEGLRHILISPHAAPSPLDALLEARGVRREIVLTLAHFVVAPSIVAHSDYALTAPERLVAATSPGLRLRSLALPIRLPGYALSQVWDRALDADEGHRWLRGAIRRASAAAG